MSSVAIYVRVSTEEQAREGVSLDAQEQRAKAYCEANGIAPCTVFRDEGVSASKPIADRPQGALLTAAVARGEVRHVVALKLDRLFRDAVDCLEVTRGWDRTGVAMHLIDMGGQAINTKTALGRFFLTLMAAAAEMERNLIRERTTAALQHKKARGDRLGATPLGYVTPGPGQAMRPIREEIETVRLILSLRKRDPKRWSFREIAARLERDGHRTKRGGTWAPQTVKRVWDRRASYEGFL